MKERDENLERAYRNLLVRMVHDEIVRVDEARPILSAIGRSQDGFFDDVERARKGVSMEEILRAAVGE